MPPAGKLVGGTLTGLDNIMFYYLRHPVHGTKVAISEMELENDYEDGWEEFDPAEPAVQEEEPAPSASVNALKTRRTKRS